MKNILLTLFGLIALYACKTTEEIAVEAPVMIDLEAAEVVPEKGE